MLKAISYAALGLSCDAAWFGHHSWFWTFPALVLCVLAAARDVSDGARPDFDARIAPDLAVADFKYEAMSMRSGRPDPRFVPRHAGLSVSRHQEDLDWMRLGAGSAVAYRDAPLGRISVILRTSVHGDGRW